MDLLPTKIHNKDTQNRCLEIIKNSSPTQCPTCKSQHRIKFGIYKGNQRYKCKQCGKHYRQTSTSSIHRIHKKQLLEAYIECMVKGYTLRATASQIGISVKTAFSWRHIILKQISIKHRASQSTRKAISIYTTNYSQKGSKRKDKKRLLSKINSIIIYDHTGRLLLKTKQTGKTEILPQTTEYIPSKSIPKILKPAYKSQMTKEDKFIKQKITDWLFKFRGVATKYLNNYWAWFSLKEEMEIIKSPAYKMIEYGT